MREQLALLAHGLDTRNAKHVHVADNTSWRSLERVFGKNASKRPEVVSRIGLDLMPGPLRMPGTAPATVPGPSLLQLAPLARQGQGRQRCQPAGEPNGLVIAQGHVAREMHPAGLLSLAVSLLGRVAVREPHCRPVSGHHLAGHGSRPARGGVMHHRVLADEYIVPTVGPSGVVPDGVLARSACIAVERCGPMMRRERQPAVAKRRCWPELRRLILFGFYRASRSTYERSEYLPAKPGAL